VSDKLHELEDKYRELQKEHENYQEEYDKIAELLDEYGIEDAFFDVKFKLSARVEKALVRI
jgi:U3 small nucleolar ribonucleoprotein component